MQGDPQYFASVASACMDAMREAEQRIAAGDFGADFRDLVRHARELHDIMAEELADSSRAMGEYAGGVLLDFGEKIRALERRLEASPGGTPG